jgi:hypothetical protein
MTATLDQGISPDLKERLISTYLKTSKGRAKLVAATFNPARCRLEYPIPEGYPVENLTSLIDYMKRIKGALDGTEEDVDLTRFNSLLGDLQGLRDKLLNVT